MKLLRYAASHAKATLITAAVSGTVGGALSAATLAIVADALRDGRSTSRQAIAFVAMTIGGCGLRFLSTELLMRFSQRRLTEMSRDICHRVVASGLRQVEELGQPRLLGTLTEDLIVITQAVSALPIVITQGAIFVACYLYVAWLSWQVWLIGTICVVAGLASHAWIARRSGKLAATGRSMQDRLFGHYHALTDGFTELKLHRPRRQAFLSQVIGRALDTITDIHIASLSMFNMAANYNQMMFFVVIGVLVFGATQWTAADTPTITGAILALLYGRAPLETLVNWTPTVVRANIALARYEEVIDRLPAEHVRDEATPPIARCRRIDLAGVEYQYTRDDSDRFDLGPIDLTIRAGEILFVTGGNGSGKSTLAKIIAGLYPPGRGRVLVDGEPVTSANRDHYRQLISSVFASFHLFDRLLGLERPALDREAAEWLTRMRLHERIRIENGSFSDLHLSTGQRKRVALLVTMLEDRPVCIFDEWAADQDAEYREEFYSSVLPELKARGKVVIVISHDDRYYGLGDRVIKLDRGKIVADEAAAPVPIAARA